MSEHREEINRLAEEFESCQKILLALGDENRQHLMLEMMRMEHCGGTRVGAITEKTNLSRPAVSHHIQILKEASHSQRIFLSMGNCLIDNHASCMKMCILIILYHSDPAAVP